MKDEGCSLPPFLHTQPPRPPASILQQRPTGGAARSSPPQRAVHGSNPTVPAASDDAPEKSDCLPSTDGNGHPAGLRSAPPTTLAPAPPPTQSPAGCHPGDD